MQTVEKKRSFVLSPTISTGMNLHLGVTGRNWFSRLLLFGLIAGLVQSWMVF
jgi:hypothetical protein